MKVLARHPARSLLAAALLAAAPLAQTLTTETVATGFDRPLWAGSPPGDERIFVLEQNTGLIKIIDGSGTVLPEPFLDISDQIIGGYEMGLLSLAFHPKFALNGTFFITYVRPAVEEVNDQISVVSRWQVDDDDLNQADDSSEVVLFEVVQFTQNHNVMDLKFGPLDGYMYVASGDGGGPNGPNCLSQNLTRLEGKILRIDVDNPDPGLEYGIPTDNPYYGDSDPLVRQEIWSIGWRNPWRIGFDPLTGDFYAGDVGESLRDIINFEPPLTPNRNYGWPVMEGDLCNFLGLGGCQSAGIFSPTCFDSFLVDPLHNIESPSSNGAVIGGVVYRGCVMPDLQGTYVFGDKGSSSYYSMEISFDPMVCNPMSLPGLPPYCKTNFIDRTPELASSGFNPVHFGEDGRGEILIAEYSQGRVNRIVPATPPAIVDCDGNGQDDLCEAATYAHIDMDASGVPDACESFDADQAGFCLSTGDRQNWSLHPGGFFANDLYMVVGTFAGTSPGLDFGPVNLPLNFDSYMYLMLTLPNQLPFSSSFGFLDGQGTASASFFAGPGLPATVAGLTAHHAFVVIDDFGGVSFASNYTSLTFEP